MNILASYSWLKEYVQTQLSPEDFARELSLKSMSVETLSRIGERFQGMVIGVVKTIVKHPGADRLRVASVDIGENIVEIVCGGTNLAEGMSVVVALPGSKVRWHGGADWTTLEKTTIRGVESIGMICAPSEVGLDYIPCGDHEIWDVTAIVNCDAGTPVADALDLNDVVFDIEVTTNRPDAMGMVGLAREAAVAVGGRFVAPTVALNSVSTSPSLEVKIEDDRCERYMAAVVGGVAVGQSPWWMQRRLVLAGYRPINTIVDITNYVLLELGQPLHAFDRSVIAGESIVVRAGKKDETLTLLDGKIAKLDESIIVIADSEKPLALAGMMGGKDSGTTSSTTTVVFEAATFNGATIRRAARALDVATDSQLLFEKGLSPSALPIALARAVELATQIAGGTLVDVVDVYPVPRVPKVFPLFTQQIRDRIGVDIDNAQQVDILTKLGFIVAPKGDAFSVTVPYWREDDIEESVDFTEEVARMYGYHNMPSLLPASRPPAGRDDVTLEWELWSKRFLASAGFSEFFNYSLVSVQDLEMYGVSPKDALAVFNPLSTDLTHMRSTLIPSVLRAVERNQALTPSAKVFELARVYIPQDGSLPDERLTMVFGEYGATDAESVFMHLRGALELFAEKAGLEFVFERLDSNSHWHGGRSVSVSIHGVAVGTLGQVASDFQSAFGIHRPVFLAELDLEAIIPFMRHSYRYEALPMFPVVVRDIAVLVDEHAEYEKICTVARGSQSLVTHCNIVDIYRGEGIPAGKKSVTLSLTFMAPDRTLTSDEVEGVLTTVTRELLLRIDGVVRS